MLCILWLYCCYIDGNMLYYECFDSVVRYSMFCWLIIIDAMWSRNSYTMFRSYIEYFSHVDPIFQYLSQLPPIVCPRKTKQLRHHLQ